MADPFHDKLGVPPPVRLSEYEQLRRNLAWLATHDLKTKLEDLKMAVQTLNEMIDSVQATEAQLIPAIMALVADDATQHQRADALQAAADALTATGTTVDAAHAATLRGMSSDLANLLTSLVPAPPVTVPPVTVPPVPTPPANTNPTGVATDPTSGPTLPAVPPVPAVPATAPDAPGGPGGLPSGPGGLPGDVPVPATPSLTP